MVRASAEMPKRWRPRPTGSRRRSTLARQRPSSMLEAVLSAGVGPLVNRCRKPVRSSRSGSATSASAAGNDRDEGNRSPRRTPGTRGRRLRARLSRRTAGRGAGQGVDRRIPGPSTGGAMIPVSSEKIRNVALVGHGGAGKTTLAEALLFVAGADRRGWARSRTARRPRDFDPEEHKRTISVSLAVAPFEWEGHKVNVIDTPGYADFVGDVAAGAPRRRPRDLRRVRGRGRRGPDRGRVAPGRGARHAPGDLREQARPRARVVRAHARRPQGRVRHRRRAAASSPSARKPSSAASSTCCSTRPSRTPARRAAARPGPIPAEMETEEHAVHDALIEGIVVADDDLMERYLADETIEVARARARAREGHRRGAACSRCCAGARRELVGVDRLAHFIAEEGPAPDVGRRRRRPRSCSRRSSTPTSGA